jgi:hypothetical protein
MGEMMTDFAGAVERLARQVAKGKVRGGCKLSFDDAEILLDAVRSLESLEAMSLRQAYKVLAVEVDRRKRVRAKKGPQTRSFDEIVGGGTIDKPQLCLVGEKGPERLVG